MGGWPRLYAIVDSDACAWAGRLPLDVARAFLSAGVRCLQLRAKGLESGPFLELALVVVAEMDAAGGTVIVNDRGDLAVLSGAQGLHIGQEDLPPAAARRVIGSSLILGLSTHSQPQWDTGALEPVSYLAIGPVHGTATKETGHSPVGLEAVRRASLVGTGAGLPVVAIGGITLENAPAVIAAGAASVAVIGDLLNGDPEVRARAFLAALA